MWNDRIRFPVSVNTLTHYYQDSDTNTRLLLYYTQYGALVTKAKSIVNSDKVFWERRTDSILYIASIVTSSGEADLLNDFNLFDCNNIIPEETDFSIIEGVWIPDNTDQDRSGEVFLQAPSYIESIYLYDNPCLNDNVLNASIVFDDGSVVN